MRKILISLVLLALSIQTSYATVVAYCQEAQVTTSYAAHHEHDKQESDVLSKNSVTNDSECGVCHLAHSPALHSTSSISIATISSHFENTPVEFLVNTSLPPPEKPNWFALA